MIHVRFLSKIYYLSRHIIYLLDAPGSLERALVEVFVI